MNKPLLVLLSVTTVCFASLSPAAPPVWTEARMDVQADQPVNPHFPPSGPSHWLFQGPPAESKLLEAKLFVGMFDEYDEATAIIPMSDDSPPTPERPGVGATFYNGAHAGESGDIVSLPSAKLELGVPSPSKKTNLDHFCVRMGGRVIFPKAGAYPFSVQEAAGDGVELFLNGRSILHSTVLQNTTVTAGRPIIVAKGDAMAFLLDYRHGTRMSKLLLLWEGPELHHQPVHPNALRDAWGRFIINEGKSPTGGCN